MVTGTHETERRPLLSTEYEDNVQFLVQPARTMNTIRNPTTTIPLRMDQHPRQHWIRQIVLASTIVPFLIMPIRSRIAKSTTSITSSSSLPYS